jgi:hypothetical protein
MIAYDLDPSLHLAEPAPVLLEDGFSAPRPGPAGAQERPDPLVPAGLERALGEKSDF